MNYFGIAFVLIMACLPFAAYLHERRNILNAKPKTENENPGISRESEVTSAAK